MDFKYAFNCRCTNIFGVLTLGESNDTR